MTITAAKRVLRRPVISSSSFACTSEATTHFGLGRSDTIDSLTIRWSDGTSESFDAGGVDRLLVLRRGEGSRGN